MTNKIVRLRKPASSRGSQGPLQVDVDVAVRSIQQSARLVAADLEKAIETLENKLAYIRDRIDAMPDTEISQRLARDHAVLTAALHHARYKAVSIVGIHPGKSTPHHTPSPLPKPRTRIE